MQSISLLLGLLIVEQVTSSTCYVSQSSSIRREVVNVVPQSTLAACQSACDADSKCEATLLNAVGTHCILLGGQIADASSNVCPAPFTAYVKTTCDMTTSSSSTTASTASGTSSASSSTASTTTAAPGATSTTSTSGQITTSTATTSAGETTTTTVGTSTTTIGTTTTTATSTTTSTSGTTTTTVRVKGPIDDYYTVGECSRVSDIVGSPTEGASPPCGTPPLSQRRIVIDAIKDDGTHMVLENNLYSLIKWDDSKKSWYFEIEATDTINKVYFYTAKCVLPPVTPLTPACECAALNTESAYSGNYNPVPVKIDTDPCCTKDYVQMNCVRAYSTETTYSSGERLISCTMGEWLMLRTGSGHYNSYLIRAAACVD